MKHYEGNLIIKEGDNRDFSKLETVTGDLNIYSNVKAELPVLASVGGDLHIYSNVIFNHKITKGKKYLSVDRSLFIIESEKTAKGIKIYSGYNVVGIEKFKAKKQQCYVASKGDFSLTEKH